MTAGRNRARHTVVSAAVRIPRHGLRLASSSWVDCWIGIVQQDDRCLVQLAGRLSVAQVPELFDACAEAAPLHIDLTELVSADAAGIEALQRLRGHGATLFGASGYLQLKLDSPSDNMPTTPLPRDTRKKPPDR